MMLGEKNKCLLMWDTEFHTNLTERFNDYGTNRSVEDKTPEHSHISVELQPIAIWHLNVEWNIYFK